MLSYRYAHGLLPGFWVPMWKKIFFSKIKYRKSHYRSAFTDEH